VTTAVLTLRAGWPLYAGMTVAGAAAVVASASTLAALARAAGWAGWTPWLLPGAVDVGGSVGGWVWLRPGTPERARRFGRVVALSGAAASLVGNGSGHLIATGYLRPGPGLVVIVGAVPAAVLVALAHLSALLATPEQATPEQATPEHADDEPPEGKDGDSPGTRAAVLAAARAEPVTVADLVNATGRSRTTIVGHLTALRASGLIARGPDKRYRAVPRPLSLPSAGPGESDAGEPTS
jgi:DNA-binding transcriptional ArsR family regulator